MNKATTVNMISKRPNGKLVKKSLPYANSAASDNNIARFVKGFAALSDNTLENIEKVQTSTIDFETE